MRTECLCSHTSYLKLLEGFSSMIVHAESTLKIPVNINDVYQVGVTTVNNTTNICLITDVFIRDKSYMFRPTVDIIRFYQKLYAKEESLYNMRHHVSMLKSHHLCVRTMFYILWFKCGLLLVAGVVHRTNKNPRLGHKK